MESILNQMITISIQISICQKKKSLKLNRDFVSVSIRYITLNCSSKVQSCETLLLLSRDMLDWEKIVFHNPTFLQKVLLNTLYVLKKSPKRICIRKCGNLKKKVTTVSIQNEK